MDMLIKLARIALLAMAVAAVNSCGGDVGGHVPSISNLRYSPSVAVETPSGTSSVNVLVDFSDNAGDVVSARIATSAGADLTVPLHDLSGVKTGTASVTFVVAIDTAGQYTFDLWFVDSRGSASNKRTGTFEVLARDAAYHPPSIWNLRYSPATAVQAAGGTASILASVDFADAGGDIASVRVTTSGGADLTIPLANLDGIQSGTGTGTFIVPIDTVGQYTFEVWLVDATNGASNRLSGTFEVLPSTTISHPAVISNLQYVPKNAVQTASGTASINVSIDFTDTGGDVVSARLMSTAGPDLTVPVSAVAGLTRGTANATFVVSTTTLGASKFEVWLIDSRDDASNRLSGSFEVLPAEPPAAWTVLPVTPPAPLLAIAWNGAQFPQPVQYVAVGAKGTVMTSPDLSTWTVRLRDESHALNSIAGAASAFVAVGNDSKGEAVVITSSDGVAWFVRYLAGDCVSGTCASPSQLTKVIWTGTQFVAVGMEKPAGSQMSYALVLTSPDGTVWTKRAPQAMPLSDEWVYYPQRFVGSVAWSGSVLVLTALDPNWDPVVWVSPDANAWTQYHMPPDVIWSVPLRDIVWGNGEFVAVQDVPGFDGNTPVFTSLDGVHWTVDTTITTLPPMKAITARPGEFFAVGGAYSQVSSDGLNWTVSSHPAGCGNDVLWDGGRYLAVGSTSICRWP
jgi:hypothetical protein